MTRLAIIGTSHVAALKMGWERLAPGWPELEVEFFAARRTVYEAFGFLDPRKYGITDETAFAEVDVARVIETFGRTSIDLSGFDHVLSAGWDIAVNEFVSLLASHDIDGLVAGRDRPRLSATAFSAFADAIAERAKGSPGWWHWDRPRIHVLPAPRPMVEPSRRLKRRDRPWAMLAELSDARSALGRYDAMVEQQLARVGLDFIALPDEVHSEIGVTLPQYTNGAVLIRKDRAAGDDDNTHMNADYGTIVLAHALARICQTPDTARNGT